MTAFELRSTHRKPVSQTNMGQQIKAREGTFQCPSCRGYHTGVMDSRPSKGGGIRRRRGCTDCEHRWTTLERAAADITSAELTQMKDRLRATINAAQDMLALLERLDADPA